MNLVFLADRTEAIPLVARWYFDEWGHKIDGNSIEKTCGKIREKLNRDKAPLHLVAIDGEHVLGVAQLKIREMDVYPEREFWLGDVFVAPEHRGRGVASGLALKIIGIARSFGIAKLYLQTTKLDGGLYARLGWQPVEQVHYKGLDVVVMQRELGE